jgi:hypothetical protein
MYQCTASLEDLDKHSKLKKAAESPAAKPNPHGVGHALVPYPLHSSVTSITRVPHELLFYPENLNIMALAAWRAPAR